ncbi:amidohydrolase family protein [Rhizobium laguerreae]|uniref:amidohydrolase family protein n=1 Tax=Rhizobium laguerreae TaxID=1076926 RepID=UPI001C8FE4EA|nr:amidohydrolase family protein [Rhizobium laguerreae]MBY3163905.1 amidohydrolase family protein [Rhizobium laguerreae]
MIIDAHHHLWSLARGDYVFPSPGDTVLYRDYMPSELGPHLVDNGVAGTIVVQATDTIEESEFLLDLAFQSRFIKGVVAWWNLKDGAMLDALLTHRGAMKLVGLRPMLQRFADIDWILEDAIIDNLSAIAGKGLVFDALIGPHQLNAVSEICRRVPSLQVVINHMGKPWRDPLNLSNWVTQMSALAKADNCSVKISGFPHGNVPGQEFLHFEPLISRLKDRFGIERLIWGSDWPVAVREGGYQFVLTKALASFGASERDRVFASNAIRLYSLNESF